MNQSATLYVSLDLELSGNFPDVHFVTEIGLAAYDSTGRQFATLQVFLRPDPGKCFDPGTEEWYKKQPGYASWEVRAVDPLAGMKTVQSWIAKCTKAIAASRMAFIAYPTSFDGMWFNIMWFRHLGHPTNGKGPGFSYIDIRSFGAGALGCSVAEASKNRRLAPYVPTDLVHTHLGVDDAMEQGQLFFALKRKSKANHAVPLPPSPFV